MYHCITSNHFPNNPFHWIWILNLNLFHRLQKQTVEYFLNLHNIPSCHLIYIIHSDFRYKFRDFRFTTHSFIFWHFHWKSNWNSFIYSKEFSFWMSNPFYYTKTAAGTLAHLALALGWVDLVCYWCYVYIHTYIFSDICVPDIQCESE